MDWDRRMVTRTNGKRANIHSDNYNRFGFVTGAGSVTFMI